MNICLGTSPVRRFWYGSDAFTAKLGTAKVWTSAEAENWVRLAENGSITLLLHRGTSSFLTIPAQLDGVPVTALAPSACTFTRAKLAVLPPSVSLLA
ncbi:MAG: hypothetical protein IJ265_03710 [Oscillospiraceae bacterium]|nr:hypothetical protein [Oscillospiraceae bacterium]